MIGFLALLVILSIVGPIFLVIYICELIDRKMEERENDKMYEEFRKHHPNCTSEYWGKDHVYWLLKYFEDKRAGLY